MNVLVPPEGGAVSETPIETLRRAAALMRERAAGAQPGPWEHDAGTGEVYVGQETVVDGLNPASSEHIASWHPGVAMAVADWLVEAAEFIDSYPVLQRGHVDGRPCDDFACRLKHAALRIARAYLGEENQQR